MGPEDQMWIKVFLVFITALLKMLYYFWHVEAKDPFLFHKFTS